MTLEIRKLLVLSTAHLTAETINRLECTFTDDWPAVGGDYGEYGWVFYAHDEKAGIGKDQIPDDLWNVMVFARKQGCDNILFDRDAEIIPELPHWNV